MAIIDSQQSLVQNGPVSQTSSSQVSMSSWSSSSLPSSSQVSSISSDENDGALRIDVTSVTYNSTDVRACQVQLVRCEVCLPIANTCIVDKSILYGIVFYFQ